MYIHYFKNHKYNPLIENKNHNIKRIIFINFFNKYSILNYYYYYIYCYCF